MRRKTLKFLTMLTVLLMGLTIFSTQSEATVSTTGNRVVMDVQDALDLYMYIRELEVENKILKEQIERERLAVQEYVKTANELVDKHNQERTAWENLAAEMNAELKKSEIKTYKYAFIGLVLGGVIGAAVD